MGEFRIMSVKCRPTYTLLLNSKIGVYRGIHYFVIVALKHRLWVVVKTASIISFLQLFKFTAYCIGMFALMEY